MLCNQNGYIPEVLIVVKQFWLTDISQLQAINLKSPPKAEHISGAFCKLDVFIKNRESYLPLVRIDTTIYTNEYLIDILYPLATEVFTAIEKKIETAFNQNRFAGKKEFSREAIYNQYKQLFNYPVFTDVAPNKGVYKSFDEFKANKPYLTNFVMRKNEKEPPSLYIIDEKGNETFTRKVWGVSDGENIYIMQSGLLFKLFRHQHSFYWMGLKSMTSKQTGIPIIIPVPGGIIYGVEPSSSYMKISFTPYCLNLDTGEEF
jgi:hypothetical protein